MNLHTIPSEKEFLPFYLIQMGGWWNMYDRNNVLTASNLTLEQRNKIMDNYDKCYEIYIKNKKLVPAQEWWNENRCLQSVSDFSSELNIPLNIKFIKSVLKIRNIHNGRMDMDF